MVFRGLGISKIFKINNRKVKVDPKFMIDLDFMVGITTEIPAAMM
jgi:hypothetical protein